MSRYCLLLAVALVGFANTGCALLRLQPLLARAQNDETVTTPTPPRPAPPMVRVKFAPAPPPPERVDDVSLHLPFHDSGAVEFCAEDQKPARPETVLQCLFGVPPKRSNGDDDDGLITDRPDFTESSQAIGEGRVQIEMGYLFTHDEEDDTFTRSHSLPNVLLRIGMFNDWFELRIGQTYTDNRTRTGGNVTGTNGPEDTLLAFRFDITEEKGLIPQSSLVYQMLLPTGAKDQSANEVLPGVAYWYSWDLVPDHISLAGGSQINRARDDTGAFYALFAQSFVFGFEWTEKIGSYIEWFGLFPGGAADPGVRTQHFLDGGITYGVTDNLQLDILAGIGLNEAAADFFLGTGLVWRH